MLFRSQGTTYQDNTFNNKASDVTAVAVAHNGVVLVNNDHAPLRDKAPVENLNFEFVVNNDALIINLTEPLNRIEKTIVTFTVTDVRDLNGNSILSPITWSAYIDRNQLRWEEDVMDITKKVYEPYEFKVRALNNGGTIQNYTVSNQPSWLTVAPVKGSIAPTKYTDINFSISEVLNVGTYNEVIYLTNSENISEALELNVTVRSEERRVGKEC